MEKGSSLTTLANNKGFSLFEVLVAMTIFAVFATVYVTAQGYNVSDSEKLRNEIKLKDLCENKLNEIITNPPELRDTLTATKEEKDFEKEPNFRYSIQYKKFVFPDVTNFKNSADEDNGNKAEPETKEAQLEKKLFKVFKENMEKMIWQIEVKVTDKNTNNSLSLSTWLYNHNAEVKVDAF